MKNNRIWTYVKYELEGGLIFLHAQGGWIFSHAERGGCNFFWVTDQSFPLVQYEMATP